MSKPVQKVVVTTFEGRKTDAEAVFDSGSFYTLVREDCLPEGSLIIRPGQSRYLGTEKEGSKISITGSVHLEIEIRGRQIEGEAYVSPDLSAQLLIGAGLMQMWDITIKNSNGSTTVEIGRDRNDPHIQTVL